MALVNRGRTFSGEHDRKQHSDTVTWRLAQLSEAQFKKFSALVYEKVGIYLKPEKKELLNARLGKRLRACKIDSFKEYYKYVVNDSTGRELVQFIDSVSTNFTSFFREKGHFDFLTSSVLPSFVLEKRGGNNGVALWSAACSSAINGTRCCSRPDFWRASWPRGSCSRAAHDRSASRPLRAGRCAGCCFDSSTRRASRSLRVATQLGGT